MYYGREENPKLHAKTCGRKSLRFAQQREKKRQIFTLFFLISRLFFLEICDITCLLPSWAEFMGERGTWMDRQKKAGYQELLLDQLVSDILEGAADGFIFRKD